MDVSIDTNFVEIEKNLRNILNSLEEGILAVNNKGNVIHYNKQFKSIFGMEKVDSNIVSIGKYIMNRVKSNEDLKGRIESILSKSEEHFNIIFMDNGKRIEVCSKPLLDNNEKTGVVFTFKDISQKEKDNAVSYEKKETYNELIEFFPEAIVVVIEHKIKLINASFINMLGYNCYFEIQGRDIRNFVHNDNIKDISKYIYSSQVNNKISKQIEVKLEKFDKTIIDVEITSAYLPWNEENAVTMIIRDITYKKQTEIALRKSEERHRKLIEFLPAGIFIHSNGKVLFANSHFAKDIGSNNPKELVGKEVMSFVHPKSRSLVRKRIDKIEIENESVPFMEETVLTLDGKPITLEVTGTPFIYEGKIACLVVAQDIDEKRKAQESTRLLNEAIAYEKLRTEFFANLSHELRTPLNVIFGAIQLLHMHMEKNEKNQDINKTKKYIEIMKQNSYRLMRLVNNIIDVTKLDAEYIEIKFKNYNIIEIVENITQSVVEYALNKNIEIIFDTDIEEKIIACDADKIERIMLNLISNAIKFTNYGGKIFVNMYDKNNEIEISIKDTGIGIPDNKIHSIFKRFVQVDKSLTRSNEGSGIGLSLVKSFVELHGGDIKVKSELGYGSEFIIKLPVRITENDATEDADDRAVQNRIERINIEFSDIYS